MAEKLKPTIDFEKVQSFGYPLWLTGFLEIGSGMFFDRLTIRKKGRETPYAYPVMFFGDRDSERMEMLQAIVGGRLKQQSLVVTADDASWLAYCMKPYAVTRRDIINAFLEWSAADFTENRVAIAERFRGKRIINTSSVLDYAELVKESEFVAGILDGRGSVNHRESVSRDGIWSWNRETVNFVSINGPLLKALYETYGGQEYTVMTNAGDHITIRGEPVVLKNDSARWSIGAGLMKELIEWANPKLPLSNR